jgi:hypothetical protein
MRKEKTDAATLVDAVRAPAAGCRKFRRGSFTLEPPSSLTSLNHLVGAAGQGQRYGDAKRLGSLEIQE